MTISGSLTNIYRNHRLPAGCRPRRADGRPEQPIEELGYQALDPKKFDLRTFSAADNLYKAFQQLVEGGGHGAGIDGFGPENSRITNCDRSYERCLGHLAHSTTKMTMTIRTSTDHIPCELSKSPKARQKSGHWHSKGSRTGWSPKRC